MGLFVCLFALSDTHSLWIWHKTITDRAIRDSRRVDECIDRWW